MSWFVVDVESDGPVPGKYSMVSFGAVLVEPSLSRTFYGQTRPTSEHFIPEALAISGHSREQHLAFEDPAVVMARFRDWLAANSQGRPVFVSDNVAFDWQWVNYAFHTTLGANRSATPAAASATCTAEWSKTPSPPGSTCARPPTPTTPSTTPRATPRRSSP
jgi:hypothetical protein